MTGQRTEFTLGGAGNNERRLARPDDALCGDAGTEDAGTEDAGTEDLLDRKITQTAYNLVAPKTEADLDVFVRALGAAIA